MASSGARCHVATSGTSSGFPDAQATGNRVFFVQEALDRWLGNGDVELAQRRRSSHAYDSSGIANKICGRRIQCCRCGTGALVIPSRRRQPARSLTVTACAASFDEFRVYGAALTADQISLRHLSGRPRFSSLTGSPQGVCGACPSFFLWLRATPLCWFSTG